MPRRIAACLALVAFAVCLVIGERADNPFATTVGRALVAMAGTFVVGLIVGAMGQKMLEENVTAEQKKLRDSEAKPTVNDR